MQNNGGLRIVNFRPFLSHKYTEPAAISHEHYFKIHFVNKTQLPFDGQSLNVLKTKNYWCHAWPGKDRVGGEKEKGKRGKRVGRREIEKKTYQ